MRVYTRYACVCVLYMRNQELKAKFSEHYGEEYSRGIPKWRAIGICGSEILFQQALASGDLEAVDDAGKTYYKWHEVKTGSKSGKRREQQLSGSADISVEELQLGMALLDTFLGLRIASRLYISSA